MKFALAIVATMACLAGSAFARNPKSTINGTIAAAISIHQSQCGGIRGYCDPWPNCPDPYDGRGSWQDTKNCESPGMSWFVDPPGYYCGPLQMDPYLWRVQIKKYHVPCYN